MGHSFPELGVERDDCREMTWIESAVYAAGHTNSEPIEILLDRGSQPKVFNEGSGSSYSEAKVWGEKYFKNNFRRLAMVKAEVDPGNFFSHEQSIPPLVVETEKISQ
ncbi:hypothetical protein OPV22_027430 [Ensete ventricosum]|nr:hypothetical protein OPV22_027430 [Ensete ventricosum]